MAGIQTSNITTAGNGDLILQPGGSGKTKVKSILANNPGTTPVAVGTANQLQKLNVSTLNTKPSGFDNDFILIHDSTTNTTRKVLISSIL